MRIALIAALSALLATPALADGFSKISDRAEFLSLVQGHDLKRFGIRLVVTPDGKIAGRAFGRNVTGAWQWNAGYFCRELSWGAKNVALNCQVVKVQDDTVRFIADKGTGDHADFALR